MNESVAWMEMKAPWHEGPSIYERILEWEGQGRAVSDLTFEVPESGSSYWAAGARDGVASHHGEFEDETLRAKQITKALRDLLASSTDANFAHLHRLVTRGPILGVLDQVLGEIVNGTWVDPSSFHDFAEFVCLAATEPEWVKLGLGMIGVLSGSDDVELLQTLGQHDEFTLYAAVAIQGTVADPEAELMRLAGKVHGWGRIHVVERLAQSDQPEVLAWLMRDGFRNHVMDAYLALIVARAGELPEALEAAPEDPELLRGAADILLALFEGGPNEDIDDYEDAAAAAAAWTHALMAQPELRTITQLRVLAELRSFLSEAESLARDADEVGLGIDADFLWQEREQRSGWTSERRAEVGAAVDALLDDDRWAALVGEALGADDPATYDQGIAGADVLGIDTLDEDLRRLQANPGWLGGWHRVADRSAEQAAALDALVDLASRALPLEEIGSGADHRYDFGPETVAHDALAVTLEAAGESRERPWSLLDVALRSPLVRVRATALTVLERWLELTAESGVDLGCDVAGLAARIDAWREAEVSEELVEGLRVAESTAKKLAGA